MHLMNNSVVDTANYFVGEMEKVISKNNETLITDPTRYDLRSQNFDCKIWIDKIKYHINNRISPTRGWEKYDVSMLRYIINKIVPKCLNR